jgi:8-oxo-dGTP pyrophosphatase MutT (NUDIX family)
MQSNVSIQEATDDQPFCAGVVIRQRGSLLVTLNTDGLPAELANTSWRIGGVGGGQEPNESIVECARREAREEIQTDVRLLSSPTTYFHDIDAGTLTIVNCVDMPPAPLLFERMRNPRPTTPYKPGLPVGPYIYFALYLAEPLADTMRPGDDVVGLLSLPINLWPKLEAQPTLQEMLDAGASVVCDETGASARRLWVAKNESFRIVAKILQERLDLLA